MLMITIDDLHKVELKVAEILHAERVEGSEKLLRLELDAGDREEDGLVRRRQIVSGIARVYTPESLIGKQIIIVANLEPRKLMGLESQGMLVAASDESGPAIVSPERKIPNGTQLG